MSTIDKDMYLAHSRFLSPGDRNTVSVSGSYIYHNLLKPSVDEVDKIKNPSDLFPWYEALLQTGPGQNDKLFPWLAEKANMYQMRWFVWQESAGEAGFGDLVALTMVGMPDPEVKLEMARNLWDEMGNGRLELMHDRLLRSLGDYLGPQPEDVKTLDEPIRLANLMAGLAINRRFAFYSLGSLGIVEMTAPGRVSQVAQGLARLGVPKETRRYFDLHAVLDVKHSEAWNKEVIARLPADRLREACVGAHARLRLGAACYERYRAELWEQEDLAS